MRRPPLVALALVCLPAAAAAQSAAPGAIPVTSVPAVSAPSALPPPPAAEAEPAPTRVGIDLRAAEDPAADRAFAAPTALIAPRGTISVTARAPIGPVALGEVSVALTDRIEVGIGNLFIADEGDLQTLSAKLQLWRSTRAALAASMTIVHESEPYSSDNNLLIPSLVASVCTDGDACRTLLSFHLTSFYESGADELPVMPGVSFAMGGRTKLVGEAHLNRDDQGDGFLVGYLGLRFVRAKLALDAGVGVWVDRSQPVYADCIDYCYDDYSSSPDVIPWPFVGLTARM